MNLCLFFEGTGQGIAGKITNVTRLRDLCTDDTRQKLHLEPGIGTKCCGGLSPLVVPISRVNKRSFVYKCGFIIMKNNPFRCLTVAYGI